MSVILESKSVLASDWDTKVVAEDLGEYVRLSRLVKATPVVRLVDGVLEVVSGEPFLRAAQEADPPLKEVVCLVEADEGTVQSLGFKTVSPTELLDEYPSDETYEALEILAFTRVLNLGERKLVETMISAFFKEMNAHPSSYGGNYTSISPFEWDQFQNRVRWTWKRNDQFGSHSLLFLDLLRDLDQNVSPLRSWNGMVAPHF